MKPFTSVLADPNNENRAIFKTAVRSLREFGEIFMANQLNEVQAIVESRPWDLIFISYRIKPAEVFDFLRTFRDSPISAETAVIQIFKMGEANTNKVASMIAQGFNGILCEPFSGEGLKACAMQSVGLRLESTQKRIKIALSVIIPDIAKDLAQCGGKIEQLLSKEHRELSESCRILRELADYGGLTYEAIINEVFDDMKSGRQGDYSGVSKRLKNKFALEGTAQGQLRQELLNFR